MRLALALLLVFAGVQSASAASDPCGKFADADAYNNCLAGFGPVAKPHEVTRSPDAEDISRPAAKRAAKRSRGARHSPGRSSSRHRPPRAHGRMRMEIDVPSGTQSNDPSPYKYVPPETENDVPSPYADGPSGE